MSERFRAERLDGGDAGLCCALDGDRDRLGVTCQIEADAAAGVTESLYIRLDGRHRKAGLGVRNA
jgi:hypothetical protein